jgi:hypothetical protein
VRFQVVWSRAGKLPAFVTGAGQTSYYSQSAPAARASWSHQGVSDLLTVARDRQDRGPFVEIDIVLIDAVPPCAIGAEGSGGALHGGILA